MAEGSAALETAVGAQKAAPQLQAEGFAQAESELAAKKVLWTLLLWGLQPYWAQPTVTHSLLDSPQLAAMPALDLVEGLQRYLRVATGLQAEEVLAKLLEAGCWAEDWI